MDEKVTARRSSGWIRRVAFISPLGGTREKPFHLSLARIIPHLPTKVGSENTHGSGTFEIVTALIDVPEHAVCARQASAIV
jgi:hypothetical protein